MADILHPSFEGLGLRGKHCDRLVEFHALSYTWDGQASSEIITCNDQSLPVTPNFHDPLRALRLSGQEDRFLWADALCINQSYDTEKAVQVRNMLLIYQKASEFVACLGPGKDYMREIVKAQDNEAFRFESLCKALCHPYARPWFRRIWFRQEILAARNLVLKCGIHEFRWFDMLSKPRDLLCVEPSNLDP